jgi:hypothetical protein
MILSTAAIEEKNRRPAEARNYSVHTPIVITPPTVVVNGRASESSL